MASSKIVLQSGFFNAILNSDGTYDRAYSASDFSNMLQAIVNDGVAPNKGNAFELSKDSASNYSLQIGSGAGWFKGHWVLLDSNEVITVPNTTGTLYVVITVDESTGTSGRECRIEFVSSIASNQYAIGKLELDSTGISTITYLVGSGLSGAASWITSPVQSIDASLLYASWKNKFDTDTYFLTENVDYGSSFPTTNLSKGRLFFKEVTS